MSFISSLSSTGPCTPVDPANIIDYGASRTQGHPSTDHQSQWPHESIGFGANVEQRSQTIPRFFRGHNIDISNVVAMAPEMLLEKNALYMRLKLIVGERTVELNELRAKIASQCKELETLKIRCDTYQETIDVFSRNHITLKTASGDATPIILMANVPLTTDMKKGETDARTKAKPGRQRQDSDSDSMSEYFYLQNKDGTTVSKEVISRMNEKAQAIWEALDERGLAPTTFDNIFEIAWDFYARIMLNDPEFFFLQLCDDGQWKLKEWSNSSYFSWYDNRGVQQKKAEPNDSIPDGTNPIQLGSTNKTINKTDRDSRNGDNGSKVNCRGDDYEDSTETPHSTSDSKKRKNEGMVASGSPKKQKEVETLAIPTDKNTIRNICMRHWNELQPGGQGLASEFDVYFKTLSDTDKEPFKKEMRAVPRATKKARTAAK